MKEARQRGCATPVALAAESVQARIRHLQELVGEMENRYLVLAQTVHEEHAAELWTKARTSAGAPYRSEEDFWEEAVGIKRRTAYQLIALGELLAKADDQPQALKALSGVGLHKLDILVPVLRKNPTVSTFRKWADLAKTHSREALREKVGHALGRPSKSVHEPGDRFQAYVINRMPDRDTRELAEEFFEVGARYTKGKNAVGILIAGFQECLGTWRAHVTQEVSA